jgi:hypothetical protein
MGPTGISIIKAQRKAAEIALSCYDNKTYVLLCQAAYKKLKMLARVVDLL